MFVEFTPSPETSSLKYPNNVFEMQNNVSNELNTFQTKYARYVRCQNEDTAKQVDPPCDLTTEDSFSSLTDAYIDLYSSLDGLEKVYDKQTSNDGKTTGVYKKNTEELETNHEEVLKLRKDLDSKLRYIQENKDLRTAPLYRMLHRRTLINTLLVILFFYLVFVLIFDIINR
jgi:archaellum component FlaC